MIRNEQTYTNLAWPQVLRRRSARTTRWQRLVERWARAWNRSPLECAINAEVRRYLMHKPVEPGDVVVVDQIVDEVSRSFKR